jgi:hypothetical protein
MNITNFPQLLAFLEKATSPEELANTPTRLLRRAIDMAGFHMCHWHPAKFPQKVFDNRNEIIRALHEVLD